MKIKLTYLLFFMLWISAFTACSSDDDEALVPSITLSSDINSITLKDEPNSKEVISFTATHSWKASVNANWVVINPTEGAAGEGQISVLTKENNQTGDRRTAILSISISGLKKEITLIQEAVPVLKVNQTQFELTPLEQDIEIKFSTNLPLNQINIASDKPNWITLSAPSRSLTEKSVLLHVLENQTSSERTATFELRGLNDTKDQVIVKSQMITITQKPGKSEVSTDYSQDKKVFQLQKHSIGNGIPLVFMGDGFLDKDIASNRYAEVMQKAMDNFFTEEPVKSLKEYFDIWYVNAVSANNNFGKNYSTRFSCKLEGGGSTLIEGDHNTVMNYAQEVPELKNNPNLFKEATCIIVLNTEAYAGTCYFGFGNQSQTEVYNLAIGYCPMINGFEDDMFRRVLCHECIGHGFAKLLDEYAYTDMGRIPAAEIERTKQQQSMGWAANVDFTSNRNQVIWSRFLNDSRYQGRDNYGEELGVYEGACTYWTGAFRPTNESMMRGNQHGFNAPSREAIYKRVMRTALGSPWVYDYEKFVSFDQAHLPTPTQGTTRCTPEEASRPFAKPVFTGMPIP